MLPGKGNQQLLLQQISCQQHPHCLGLSVYMPKWPSHRKYIHRALQRVAHADMPG